MPSGESQAKNGGINASRIRVALNATGLPNVLLVDMKAESDRLYSGYLHEAILLSLGGLVAIIGLLLVVFRSPKRVVRIIAPLAAAVITVTAGLAVFGQQLIILHLVGLLLVVAVGSNYALFFDRTGRPLHPGEGIMVDPKTIGHTISPALWLRCCLPASLLSQVLACFRFPMCRYCRQWV